MCSKEVLPVNRDLDDTKIMKEAAEGLLFLKKSKSQMNQSCHTTKKDVPVNALISTDSSSKKTVKISTSDKPSQQRKAQERIGILQNNVKKYEFSMQDYHVRKGEQQNNFLCDICGKFYGYSYSLKRHYLRSHINFVYLTTNDISNCNITDSSVKKHYEKHNALLKATKGQKPSLCNDNTDNEENMFPNLFCCSICVEMFDEKDSLKQHLDSHKHDKANKENKKHCSQKKNVESTFSCKHCLKNFQDADSKRKHEETHIHGCEFCHLVFIQSKDLMKHVSMNHAESYHPCFHCREYFSTQTKLQEHLTQYNTNMICSHSPFGTDDVYAKDEEASLRLGDKNSCRKFGCTVCKKCFSSYKNMRRHRRLYHNSFAGKSRSRSHEAPNLEEIRETEFYENVSSNIAYNLANNLDGKNIKQDLVAVSGETKSLKSKVSWTAYNFPPDFDLEKIDEKVECNNMIGLENNIPSVYSTDLSVNAEDTLIFKKHCSNDSKGSHLLGVIQQTDFKRTLTNPGSVEKCALDSVTNCFVSHDNQSLQNKQSIYLCNVCNRKFYSKIDIEEHELNNHTNVLCTHTELEDERMLPYLYFQNCSPVGAISHYQYLPLSTQDNRQLTCTKCNATFTNEPDFHLHILECGSKTTNGCKQDDTFSVPSDVNGQEASTKPITNTSTDIHLHVLDCESKATEVSRFNNNNSIFSKASKQKVYTKLIRSKNGIKQSRQYSVKLNGYKLFGNRLSCISRNKTKKRHNKKRILNLSKYKKKINEKGNTENKQNSNILHSSFSEVMRSNFKKIVSNLPELDQKESIDCNSNNFVLDLSTKEHTDQLLSLKSKETSDVKSKLCQKNTVFKENMQPLQNWCLHCRRPFSYLANYRKHVEYCPIKKEKEDQDNIKPLEFTKEDKPIKSLRGTVEQNIIGLFNKQSDKSEVNEPSVNDEPQLKTYQCQICCKKFSNFGNQMACIMSHKLHSDEPSTSKECLSVTENKKICTDLDTSKIKSDVSKSFLSVNGIISASAVEQNSVANQMVNRKEKNIMPFQVECNVSQETDIIEDSCSSPSMSNANVIKSGKVLCDESCSSVAVHGKNNDSKYDQTGPSNIHRTRKLSNILECNNDQTPQKQAKLKDDSSPASMSSKQRRKTRTTKKVTTKVQKSPVVENVKVSSKRKSQQNSTSKIMLRRKPTVENKRKSL